MTYDARKAATKAFGEVQSGMDKAMATVLAAKSADDRYFLGEVLLAGVVYFVLNRYAGTYVDRLGLKGLAEAHADATQEFLKSIKDKKVTDADQDKQLALLSEALKEIKARGPSPQAEAEAKKVIIQELVQAGAIEAQAEATAELMVKAVRDALGST
jgi:hypothetical protein